MTAPLHYEDFEPGLELQAGARTITEADVVAFAGLSGDYNALHTDAEFAGEGPFGERIAHGLLGLSVASGLMTQTGALNGTAIAFLGLEWRFRAPVRFGDTVRLQLRVAGRRETSRPDRGIVELALSLTNQHDEIVQEGVKTIMVRRR